MVPHILILCIAIVGLFVHGVLGFLAWGAAGYALVLLISRLMRGYSGGLIPRDMREQTVIDFIASHQEQCHRAFPGKSAYEVNRAVSELLEEIAEHAVKSNPSKDLRQAFSEAVFIPAARKVEATKSTSDLKQVVACLTGYIREHPLWYG